MRHLRDIVLCVVALTQIVSCSEDSTPDGTTPSGESVEVFFDFDVADVIGANSDEPITDATTRSETTASGSAVDNMWTIQFDKDGNYIFSAYNNVFTSTDGIYINEETTDIVFIANTFNTSLVSSSSITTKSDLDNLTYKLYSVTSWSSLDSDILHRTNGYSLLWGEINGYDAMVAGTSVTLKSSETQVKVNIVKGFDDAEGEITKIETINVPYTSYLYPNYTSDANFPASTYYRDYEWSEDDIDAAINGDGLALYLPINRRGIASETVNSTKEKALYAPENATAVRVWVKSDANLRTYTFYLGENMTDDYNLTDNYSYTYTFTFDGLGNTTTDPRIDIINEYAENDYSLVDPSNCYIINPGDDISTYYIPIDDRINTFWEDYSGEELTVFSGDAIMSDWLVEPMWYDNDQDPIGTDFSDLQNQIVIDKSIRNGKRCIKVSIGEEFDNWGNVGVAVKNMSDEILWSWHLWITDYNPYGDATDTENDLVKSVTNGELHQYGGDIFAEGGDYEDRYMMDRNIGARSADPKDGGYLGYQYGRKDPLQLDGNYNTIDSNFKYYTNYAEVNLSSEAETIAVSVRNPCVKYNYGQYGYSFWTSGVDSDISDYVWYDTSIKIEYYNNKKSIYDPSPVGFCVPKDVWEGFTGSLNTPESSEMTFIVSETVGNNDIRVYNEFAKYICTYQYYMLPYTTVTIWDYLYARCVDFDSNGYYNYSLGISTSNKTSEYEIDGCDDVISPVSPIFVRPIQQ